MKFVNIVLQPQNGSLDIWVETDVVLKDVADEEVEGENQDSNPLNEIPLSVQRKIDRNYTIHFDDMLDFTTWLLENQTVVKKCSII